MAKILLAIALAVVVYWWWRRRRAAAGAMPPGEARALLGLSQGATLDEIRDAHRRLITKVHPDAGGSAELASRVNEARDALIDELQRPR